VEFIPSPIRFASDIFSRVKSFPTRAGGRLQSLGRNLGFLKRTAIPSSKSASGSLLGKAIGPLATAGLTYADIQAGEEPWKAAGRNVSGLIGGTLVGIPAEAIPVPFTSVPGYIAGDQLGRTLWDKGIDDRGLSGLLRGKGWNNPFAPSPEATRMAGDTSIGSGGFLAPAGYELQGDYTNLSATPPGGNGDIYAGNQGGWVNAPAGYELQGDYTNLSATPIGDNVFNSEVNIDKKADELSAMREDWLKKTANSPAAKAGISDEGRWGTYLGNQAWRKDHGRSYNTALDPHLRPSSENTRRWE
jgi:hypothetical protein